jgi:hypothetical protein
MDKKEYKDILDTAAVKTGKQVEMLNDNGQSRKEKKKGKTPAAQATTQAAAPAAAQQP